MTRTKKGKTALEDPAKIEGQPTDTVIIVVGEPGAGKSTFLKNVLTCLEYPGKDLPQCSDDLDPCTNRLGVYIVNSLAPDSKYRIPGRLVLVDTPGFDKVDEGEEDTLRRVKTWLKSSYDGKMEVCDVVIVYMIQMGVAPPAAQTIADLQSFLDLFGRHKGDSPRFHITTTHWGPFLNKPAGDLKEGRLKEIFEKGIPQHAARMERLVSAEEPLSALPLLADILRASPTRKLDSKARASGPRASGPRASKPLAAVSSRRKEPAFSGLLTGDKPGKATDVVIFVVGPSESGKSTFIKNILEGDRSYKGPFPDTNDIIQASETQKITPYVTELPDGFRSATAERLVLVDTSCGVEEALKEITTWFSSTYKSNSKVEVAGVIYLYSILHPRVRKEEQAGFRALEKLLGGEALKRLYIVTTGWSLGFDRALLVKREQALRDRFWLSTVTGGSKLTRLEDNDQESAERLLTDVLKNAQTLRKDADPSEPKWYERFFQRIVDFWRGVITRKE